MIDKAIVEEIIDKYHVRIRVPKVDRLPSVGGIYTPTSELSIACICTLSNCNINLQVGDVVFVNYEGDNRKEPVIIGVLFRENNTSTAADLILNELQVLYKATLPIETSIGKITSKELSYLEGVNDNIQNQLNYLLEQVNNLLSKT